jgi:penicillin G amidase
MRRRIAVFLLLIPLVAALSGLLWLRSSLPPPDRTRQVQGLTAPVRISRDAMGIPTIVAHDDTDAAFALGYVHAEDRLYQMDVRRHFAAGRLSEWFGAPAVDSDRMMRTLGLARAAERQFDVLPPEVQAGLTAYAAGVNAYLRERRTALPLEYYLLRAEPDPWRPADGLIAGKLTAWLLAGNYRSELVHAHVAERVKPEEMPILYPAYPKDGPVVLGDLAPIYRALPLERLIALMPAIEDPARASNNWVVDGSHTVSGKPILANDPHLELQMPGFWYLTRLITPDHTLSGGTIAGSPEIIIGQNERIAWGFTNTGSDVSDLFIEKTDPDDAGKYLTPDGSRPFVTRIETIRVRGADPVEITVRETRHGPVVSDLAEFPPPTAEPGYALALSATYLMDGDRTPQAFWEINHAGDWPSFYRALAKFDAPEQNVVYADVDGHIGFAAPARVPIRAKGDGWMPMPGWTGEYDWTGFVPFDELPQLVDPPSGRIVTANNKIVPDSYPFFLGRDWDTPYRAQRIASLLDRQPQSPESTAAIQRDIFSTAADRLLPLMLDAPASTPRARSALERLKAWDRRMDKDKVEPLIFTAWLRELNRTLLADKLGGAFEDYWSLHPEVIESILREHTDWCDDRTTVVVEVCSEQLASALDRALDELTRAYGSDMDEWRWGRAHPAEFRHLLLSRIWGLRSLFRLSIPADGGNDTVNRGGMSIRNAAAPYQDVLGPGLRMVVDMADPRAAHFMIVPGQSGNPLSPNYDDLMRPWRDGYMLIIDPDRPAAVETLTPP